MNVALKSPPNFQQHEAFNNLMEEPGQLTMNGGEVVTVEWDDLGSPNVSEWHRGSLH